VYEGVILGVIDNVGVTVIDGVILLVGVMVDVIV
jgi:hypothetical protein